jgi:hypothetical protein
VTRHAHLVGAWPAPTPERAMQTALEQVGPHLVRMSDGETGDRSGWITHVLDTLRAHPDVEQVREGGLTSYDDTPQWRVKAGRTLDADTLRLRHGLAFQASFPSFKELRTKFSRPDLRFQVGIPSPTDLSLYAFGEAAFSDPSLSEAFLGATTREIRAILDLADEDIVFQIETVAALIAVAQAPDAAQQHVAEQLAAALIAIPASAPEGTTFGFHLCLGDFNHEAYGHMRDARPLVLLANAIANAWPEGRRLEYIHVPFAAAKEPPIEDLAFYEPLRELRLPADVRFIAGFLHESLELDAHKELLARIEERVGREVDVASACGLGRRETAEEAFDQMHAAAALIESTPVRA